MVGIMPEEPFGPHMDHRTGSFIGCFVGVCSHNSCSADQSESGEGEDRFGAYLAEMIEVAHACRIDLQIVAVNLRRTAPGNDLNGVVRCEKVAQFDTAEPDIVGVLGLVGCCFIDLGDLERSRTKKRTDFQCVAFLVRAGVNGRFLLFYLLGGIAAALLQVVLTADSTVPMIGASGAVSAVLGAYILKFPRARVRTLAFIFIFITVINVPAVAFIGIWFFLQVLSSLSGPMAGVAWFAHIGGFVFGLLFIKVFEKRQKRPRYRIS